MKSVTQSSPPPKAVALWLCTTNEQRETVLTNLTLSIAMGDYDRTRPIHDGRVKIDGVNPISRLAAPQLPD